MMRHLGVSFTRFDVASVEEDEDTARLVVEFQAGDKEAFAPLYERYFDRVYGYLRVLFNNRDEAEETAQQAWTQVFAALPKYERRRQPFRAWLFVVVRNTALRRLTEMGRIEPMDAAELDRYREEEAVPADDALLAALNWITDPDLTLFIERLPVVQRQILLMRFMLDMSHRQVAKVLNRSEDDVRALQYRALTFLRTRLKALEERLEAKQGITDGGDRTPMQRVPDKQNVLRARRYSLWR
jgi:RNA polymerase sigma-70 factor (ECF subfamily)